MLDQVTMTGLPFRYVTLSVTTVVLLTTVMSYYIGRFQPRIVRNPTRAVAIGALLLSMLLLAQLAAIGTGPLYTFGIAPTIVVAMILAIAYDQRFAIGVAGMHAVLVTLALDAPLSFLLIVWSGVATATSKSVKPSSTRFARSAEPTTSAPASCASFAFSPSANTATRASLPVPWGSISVPRNCSSA